MFGALLSFCGAQESVPPKEAIARFGTTVVASSGLSGGIYHISPGTPKLPKFKRLKPLGFIYTTRLNVPESNFMEGFPGVTGRFEWFAIDYNGRFWIEKPGKYQFSLASDDGSKLYIDRRMVIRNDGIHPTITREGNITLTRGVHSIRVSYFQGPGGGVALILRVAEPGEKWRVFDTDEFRPPPNTSNWR